MPAIHENKIHGTLSFPFAVYAARLPEWLQGFPLHWHEEMEIIYVQNGKIVVSIQNEDFTVSKGGLALIQPQTVHAIKQYADESSQYFNILFRFSLLSCGGKDMCYEKYFYPIYSRQLIIPKIVGSEHPLNIELIPYITRLIDSRRHNDELLVKSCLFAIMHSIVPHCSAADNNQQHLNTLYEKLKQSLTFVENNYGSVITVSQAAEVSNFSASHFSKMFRQLTGMSFVQYLKNYRLEIAAEKLLNSRSKISEIALECGFNNLSYFTLAFCEKYGVTPKEFRRGSSPAKQKIVNLDI